MCPVLPRGCFWRDTGVAHSHDSGRAQRLMGTAFHAGLRIIQGGPAYAKFATQSPTDLTTRAALAIAPLIVIVATRRLGLLCRAQASRCPGLLGFILDAQTTHRPSSSGTLSGSSRVSLVRTCRSMTFLPRPNLPRSQVESAAQDRHASRDSGTSHRRGFSTIGALSERRFRYPWHPGRKQRGLGGVALPIVQPLFPLEAVDAKASRRHP